MMAPKKSQVLIVDDYPTNIKVLSDFLIESGFEVLIARDGENALKKLQRVTPDLILLDVLMPGIDGFETCRRLKEMASTQAIPVIFMTALTDPIDKVKGLTLGAVDYITKPFQQEEVLARINLHLKLQHLTQELAVQNAQLQQEARSRQLAEMALRRSEEKFFKAFRSSPAIMAILTLEEGRILDVNQNFCRSLGYPPEAVLGRPFHQLPICRDPQKISTFFETLRTDGVIYRQEYQLHTQAGEMGWFLLSADIIQVQEVPCVLAMAFDITDCKRSATELEAAKVSAELASQAKSRFLANISHELRTPLNTILGYTQLISREATLPLAQQGYLDLVNQGSEHLLTLINDVLEMAHIESGQQTMTLTSCCVRPFLETLYALLEPKAAAKGLQFTVERSPDLPDYIRIDETKLRQVLINLLSNAIKFTEQGQVRLRAYRSAADSSIAPSHPDQPVVVLGFEVQDTGPGIAPEELPLLFDPFVQTETGRRTQTGTGLGLAISQRFMQMMQGQITVESQLGVGSTFCVSLPVVTTKAELVAPSRSQQRVLSLAPGQAQPKILVVDDHPANQTLLCKLLTLVGFDVQAAKNGAEAIACCCTWHPHLICMDLRMAGMDGYEATRQIKQQCSNQAGCCPAVIAITASAFEEERQAALAAGCDGFIRKPIQPDILFETLAEHLQVQYTYGSAVPPSAGGDEESRPSGVGDPPPAVLADSVIETLWGIVGGDQDFLIDYLTEQLQDIPRLLQGIKAGITQADARGLALAAHTLKGVARTFGADCLTTVCQTLEQGTETGSMAVPMDQVQALAQTLEAEISPLMRALEQLLTDLQADRQRGRQNEAAS